MEEKKELAIVGLGDILPSPEDVLKQQQHIVEIAEKLLKDSDYTFTVIVARNGERYPVTFETKQEAEKYLQRAKNAGVLLVDTFIKRKRKSGWAKLALHLGVTMPDLSNLKKEVALLDQTKGLYLEKVTSDGYEALTYLQLLSTSAGDVAFKVIRSEVTMKVTWKRLGRSAVATGGCSAYERRFAHPDHDVIAMAETRAFVRAVSACLGFGETGAEEFSEEPIAEEKVAIEVKEQTAKETQPVKEEQPVEEAQAAQKEQAPYTTSKVKRSEIITEQTKLLGRDKVREIVESVKKDFGYPPEVKVAGLKEEHFAELCLRFDRARG